jgi:cell wall-associated NlpC family hydrolase
VAAAAGPDAFDCSGLTLAAWRQAGVSLPHYSYAQFSSVRRIPDSELQPGDLVFYFGSGAHHVGMYIGNGKMVHAANPRDGVEITDYKGPWYGERYSGAGRVVG